MSENRCRRCNRKLIDPDAVYGWRCAKKLGVSVYMVSADGLMWQYFYDGIAIGDIIIASENLELSYEEMLELYGTVIKWSLANGVNDKYLMKLAKDDSISLSFFMSLYKSKYGENESVLHHHAEKPELSALQKYLNLQNYKHDLGNRMNFVDLVYKYLTLGYVTLPDGRTIDSENYDVKNPVLDYEWDTYMNFDYLNLVWRAGGNINTGVGAASTAIEKSEGKLNKKEVDKAAKAVYKSNAKSLGNTVTEYAGKIGRRSTYLSIAYCGIDIGMDYLDDKTFGIDSATAIAELAASSAGTYIAASIGIGMALPTGVVVAMTVVVAYVAAYAAKKGVSYINSKLGKAEMRNMCDNMMKSMLDNPDTMNEITAQLAKNNKKVAALVKQEVLISETEVGDYITGAKTDRPSPWPITNQEYNSVGLLA